MQETAVIDRYRSPLAAGLNIPGPRPRIQLTCEPCRLSKVKCDRSLPACGQCRRRSRGSACKYKSRIVYGETATSKPQGRSVGLDHAMTNASEPLTSTLWNDSASVITPPPEEELGRMIGSLKLSKDGRTQLKAPSHWESIVDDVRDLITRGSYLHARLLRYRSPILRHTLRLTRTCQTTITEPRILELLTHILA